MIKVKSILAAALASAALCVAPAASADNFPSRTMTLVVPYEPGSTVDTTSRMIAEQLTKRLGQPVVVENRTGGNGLIAMNHLQNSAPDGYTLMVDTPAIAINPSVRTVRYDPFTDLEPVAQLMALPFVVGINPDVKANNLQEFVALSKSKPGEINMAPGGTSTLLAGELFALRAGIKLQAINYKGASSAILATLRNECQVTVFDVANMAPQISAGKLRGLVIAGDQRSPAIPDVPTAKEAGLDDFNVSTWFGLFAPKGTPAPIVDKLNTTLLDIFKSPEYQAYLKARGATLNPYTAPEFKTFFHKEVSMWRDVVKDANIKIQ